MSCQLSRRSKSFVAKEKFSPEIWPKYPAMIIILKKLRTRTCVFQVLHSCGTLVKFPFSAHRTSWVTLNFFQQMILLSREFMVYFFLNSRRDTTCSSYICFCSQQ